ncbi:MAG: metallophosphoesterase [Woeseiaceae bacterium]|nr:metallophosphoesterase [Woeseiaceae bacterium]
MKTLEHTIVFVCRLLVLAAIFGAPSTGVAQQYSWTDVPRIVAISDPHGAYPAMVRTLQNAEVIDGDSNWSAGQTHLVVTGDMLDRGADSRKVMDLVMKLEGQASDAGGRVHLLLGNHEVMNLVGDLRYVAPGEYASFVDDELPEDRERWFRIFVAQQLSLGTPDEEALRAEFEQQYPPGFFGHRQALSSEGKYGRWLLEKPLIVVVNGNAFVHGGLPPIVADLGLEGINQKLGAEVADYVRALGVLNASGLFHPGLNFYRHAEKAKSMAQMTTLEPEVKSALMSIIALSRSSVHDSSGPLWYRGNVGCGRLVEGDALQTALRAIGAERVIIGHTPTQTREVLSRFDGQIIEIDTGMLNSAYRGSGHALIIENGELAVASEKTSDLGRVALHPRRVGYRPNNLSASNLEQLLANGSIVSTDTDDEGRKIVEIRLDDENTISAVFAQDENRKGLNPELAAYRLDRLIGLDMVPVTVAREVDGKRGALQYLPGNVRDEGNRTASGGGFDAWCPLPRQWGAMYVFDALIYNPGRTPTSMVYNLENWQLILSHNNESFSTKRGRPPYLANAPLEINSIWRQALQSLNDETLEKNFADVLDARRISALAKRRDELLELE